MRIKPFTVCIIPGFCARCFAKMKIQFRLSNGFGTIPKMKTGRFGSQPERPVFPVWVLTGFACYSARKFLLTYAGLLACQECGNVFSPMIRYWNGSRRVEYVCRVTNETGKVIAPLTAFTKKFWIKPSGMIQKSCGRNMQPN